MLNILVWKTNLCLLRSYLCPFMSWIQGKATHRLIIPPESSLLSLINMTVFWSLPRPYLRYRFLLSSSSYLSAHVPGYAVHAFGHINGTNPLQKNSKNLTYRDSIISANVRRAIFHNLFYVSLTLAHSRGEISRCELCALCGYEQWVNFHNARSSYLRCSTYHWESYWPSVASHLLYFWVASTRWGARAPATNLLPSVGACHVPRYHEANLIQHGALQHNSRENYARRCSRLLTR